MLKVSTLLLVLFWTIICSVCFAMEVDDLESGDLYLSPTRLKQSPHDIPASVSRITQETIRKLQINSIPSLLKYVAGMISGNASGNQPRISYHGTNGLVPRRMQVLLDGISVYRPSYAEVTWPTLPLSINDVDVVEVTRSPSAVSYGANSMMAVINIKTKDPYDVSALGLIGGVGGHGTERGEFYASHVISEDLRYRISASTEKDEGYDKNFRGEERRDSTDVKRLNSKVSYRITPNTDGEFFIGYSDALTELEYRDSNQLTFPDITTESLFVMAKVKQRLSSSHEIDFKSYYTHVKQDVEWNTCYPTILLSENLRLLHQQNPYYADALINQQIPTGGSQEDDALRDAFFAELSALGSEAFTPICGWINENDDEKKFDFEIEDTMIVTDSLRLVSGLGFQQQSLSSETYLKGDVTVNAYRVFGNAEYRLSKFVLNLGGMVEYEDSYLDKPAYSPRLGINYRLSESTSLRFIFSKAVRTPDILEHDMEWNYYTRDLVPAYPLDGRDNAYFYNTALANGEIESEEILAREISLYSSGSYYLGGGTATHVFDIKYFYDSLKNLVSEKPQYFDYELTNDGKVTLHGVEIDANFTLYDVLFDKYIDNVRFHLNYAYIDNKTDEYYERSLHARHSGAGYAIVNYRGGWFSSLSYYGNSEIKGESFDGWEFGVGKTTQVGTGDLTIKGKVVYWPDKEDSFVVSETFDVKNVNTNTKTLYVTVDYSFR